MFQNISFPVCDSFKPTLPDGQLCYHLELRKPSGQGKENELMLLLDYNTGLSIQPPRAKSSEPGTSTNVYLNTVDSEAIEAKIRINTLSKKMNFGGGSYKMTMVKKMTAKPDFLEMPLGDRNCEIEDYEVCRTKKILTECGCVPVEFTGYQVPTCLSKSLLSDLVFTKMFVGPQKMLS